MVSNSPQECDSKRIIAVKVYQPKLALVGKSKHQVLRWYHVLFWVALLMQSMYMLTTMGEPYHQFLAKADREGFQVMQGSTQRRAQFEYAFKDLNDPSRRTKKIGWMDWKDMDIEELAAEKKRDREKSVLDSLPKNMRVPSQYSCAFWPTFFLGILGTLYALVILMQYWRVDFNVWLNYREMDPTRQELPDDLLQIDVEQDLEEQAKRKQQLKDATQTVPDRKIANPPSILPTCARITPKKGPEILVDLEYYPTLGMTFEYHRRRYVYKSPHGWTKIRCQTKIPLDNLKAWKGFPSPLQLIGGQIRFGPNMFTVKQPSFVDLYKKQLLNPFSIFQMFCVLLWAIDDYILYSLFNLFMVFTFEATVVFQRIQSMKALRGMGNPSRNIYVYRSNHWTICDSSELLPGDIMSLKRIAPHRSKDATQPSAAIQDAGGDIVPADLLLLRGSTVVNEASLTGESIPQMKEGLVDLEAGDRLDMKTKHKMNVAYAGTKMLQCKGAAEIEADSTAPKLYSQIPNPPDDGCVCFVLRTGFASAQGKLVRMIEGSHDKVKGHERETGLLLLFLFCFAVMSSSYVLYHGMQNEKRSKYELLLHCIMIVTNVIRPELPMQMALAVNNALMTLMKMHIFCTEPYRVPMAGRLNVCLFDKTGTLTTDELVAGGVCEPVKLDISSGMEDADPEFLTPMTKLNGGAALVLAGCHSLVVVDEEIAGDPLEKASLSAMRWQLSVSSGHATPAPATDKRPAGNPISVADTHLTDVDVLTRHHFSSKLQRMSCVIKSSGKMFSVAKGSPEAIGRLLASKPAAYDEKAAYLAKQGYRVIALAWKQLASDSIAHQAMESRTTCEEELLFAGFIAFTCMVRKDTASVLTRLKEGGMTCAMVTGDALLTAIHVAREVEICELINKNETDAGADLTETSEELKALLLAKRGVSDTKPKQNERKIYRDLLFLEADDKGGMYWARYEDSSRAQDFVASQIPTLASTHDLATTGASLSLAYEYDPEISSMLEHIQVFARMTPDAKEKVIECLHSIGKLTMMCGDGANDVGALKASSVGVALLSGFGNLNVQKESNEKIEPKRDDGVRAIMSQEHLNEIRALPVFALKMKIRSLGCDPNKYPELKEKEDLVQLYQIKSRELAISRHDKKNQLDAKKMTPAEQKLEQRRKLEEKQLAMQRRVQELEARGETWAQFKVMKEFMANEFKEAQQKKNEMSKFSGVEGQAAMLASKLDDVDAGGVPMIKLGDASVAAPFTSKMPSIRNCVDIVRQGRCTLVNSMQMYQIMALECLISSYSLSVLYLDGVKYGDTQMTAMGILGSVSFMSVSRSKPLDKLSSVRPLTSIFHPAKFLSLLGQFAIHLGVMLFAVYSAKKHLPPDYEPDLDGTFQPGILNTCVFLVSSVQQVTVFVVNLQGRPFMTGLSENRPLLWSLLGTFILTFMFASETVPGLNRYFQLVPFPDERFRDFLLILLVMDLVATLAFDRLMQFLFSRDILIASVKGTTWKDVFGILRTFAVIAVIMSVVFGNSEQWDELLEMQTNMTNETAEESLSTSETIAACAGDLCDAVNGTIPALRDEF
ncbi:hypothetical protein MPSEU_000927700 [Mayamaea pseudoterrestris]|nr:hypothetical protein MPSEU_000927700 [Mayamaea pseudoterrestris]